MSKTRSLSLAPDHQKVALAARLIIGLESHSLACAPSGCMYTEYVEPGLYDLDGYEHLGIRNMKMRTGNERWRLHVPRERERHTRHILPPSEIDLGLFWADFTDLEGKHLFHRIG